MFIFDTSKKQKVKLETINKNEVRLYVCGPTVYDNAHLGHARSSITFDLLKRVLEQKGYTVFYAKNFTDIDDKIIKKVKETGKSLKEITSYYIQRYNEDMDSLNLQRPGIEPTATDSMDETIKLINRLLESGNAYQTSTGDVYFDISSDKKHGSLYNINNDGGLNRVISISEKKNPEDFALWKNNNDISFNSPFGEGRPGWHIECSAIINKYFPVKEGYSIDIHGGGIDLMFPHHENEATQTRNATGHELSKYWMHNGLVRINNEIMSKSTGNSFFIKDALKVFDGEVLRNYLMSIHYRNEFNFSERDLLKSKVRLDKIYRLKKRVYSLGTIDSDSEFKNKIIASLSDDLNISETLSIIDVFIQDSNESLDNNENFGAVILANIEFISDIIGIGFQNPFKYFQYGLENIDNINELVLKRDLARKEKDYTLSDTIREDLLTMNIKIIDTPKGTFWEKI